MWSRERLGEVKKSRKKTYKVLRVLPFSLLTFLLFSCTSPDVQENSNSNENIEIKTDDNNLISEKIIAVYYKEKELEIWDGATEKKVIKINEGNFPLGIQKIKSIDNDQISFHYSNSGKYSVNNIIYLNNSSINEVDNINDYTLIIVPSRPNEHGVFEGCLRCPHWTREMALKAKLEWESIFGDFKNIH